MKTEIKAVIFDLGGVLVEDVWENLLGDDTNGVAGLYGLNKNEVYKVGQELWEIFAFQSATSAHDWRQLEYEYWDLLVKRLKLSVPVDQFIELTDSFIQPVAGMILILESLLSNGIKVAIVSDNTEFWFERQSQKLELQRFLSQEQIILSSRLGVAKASPTFAMFDAAINALGVDKDNCVYFDDRDKNINVALDFGLTSILFPTQNRNRALYLGSILEKMGVI